MTLRMADSILQLIGQTPLVRINRLNENQKVQIYAKLEFMNPGGSIKDRPACCMLEAAEQKGELTKNKIVLEPTSGNTGIGLAMACAVKGYRMLFVMSESASLERQKILKAYGAEILLTPAHMATDGAIEEAYRLAREEPETYFLVDQYNNPNNWQAHYKDGTADEIWQATEGRVTHVVAAMGTTGTVMGLKRRFSELAPQVRVVAVEPFQGHKIQGLKNMKESYPPGIYNPREMDRVVHVDDDAAYETARRLAREEGIFVGMSAGAALRASLSLAQGLDKGLIVAILPDGGERYLSTPLFVSEKVPVPLKFHNTLTSKTEDLVPVRPGHVGIYACGPSLDGPADLGLARRMVLADLTRRYLEFRGFGVKLVINLADIDDRTVNQCLKEGGDLDSFTSHWEEVFFADMNALGIKPAHDYPKASEHVGEMIETTRELLDRGLAYEKLRSVYFNISRFPAYGKLSNVDLNASQKGKTVDFDYYEKENPRDFTLFKRASLAELKAGIYWKTPWGNQRPGWHVECAAMATSHLGPTFDIHMASRDLIFPHGDNEIAITESLNGKPMANIWLHSEVVMADGRKVSRPTGADLTFRDLLADSFSAAAVRYWLMSQHYSKVLNVSEKGLALASKTVERLNRFVNALATWPAGDTVLDLDQIIYEAKSRCQQAMDNDLNFPGAMGHLFAFMKKINHLLSQGKLDARQLRKVLSFMRGINHILGVMDFKTPDTDQEVERLVQKREELRTQGAYAQADAIREQLAAQGIEISDSQAGPIWKRN